MKKLHINTAYKKNKLFPKVNHGSGNGLVSVLDCQILDQNLWPSVSELKLGRKLIMQQAFQQNYR